MAPKQAQTVGAAPFRTGKAIPAGRLRPECGASRRAVAPQDTAAAGSSSDLRRASRQAAAPQPHWNWLRHNGKVTRVAESLFGGQAGPPLPRSANNINNK